MKLFKNKKGSQLVEKVLMVAFSVAAGGAVIVYGANVINQSKTTNVSLDGTVVAENSHGVQLITGQRYRFSEFPSLTGISKTDMEYFSCSDVYDENGIRKTASWNAHNTPYEGFVGYSCWEWSDDENENFYLEEPDYCGVHISFRFSEKASRELYGRDKWWCNDNYPCLNDDCCDDGWGISWSFKFAGTYVKQGNGPSFLDCLVEVEE